MRMEAVNGISEPSFVYFSLILTKDFGFVSIRPFGFECRCRFAGFTTSLPA